MTIERDRFRDLMGGWASGVTIVACRTDERVVATTVSAFTSLSIDPPLIMVALGASATVRPFLQPGERFVVNILAAEQRRLATIFADSLPVGAAPFPSDGDPVIEGSLASLVCVVDRLEPGGDHAVVIATVVEGFGGGGSPLIRFGRRYHALDG